MRPRITIKQIIYFIVCIPLIYWGVFRLQNTNELCEENMIEHLILSVLISFVINIILYLIQGKSMQIKKIE